MEYETAMNTLTDADTYEQAGVAFAGYAAPSIIDNLADRFLGFDAPDEVAGLVAIVLAAAYGGDYSRPLMAGAGVYTAESAAERVGVRDTIVNLGE